MNSDSTVIYPKIVPTAPSLYPVASVSNHSMEHHTHQAQPQQYAARHEIYKIPNIVSQPMPNYDHNIVPGLQPTQISTSAGQEPPNIVIVNNGIIPFGRVSQKTNCPHCKEAMQTFLKHRPTFRTHIMAIIFCATGLVCLSPLPYCLHSCQKVDHFCNKCDQYVGKS